MIKKLGIGIDITDVEKFKKIKFKKKPDFYRKIFSADEISYCLKFKNPYERFAGKFALKEATVKSINENIKLLDIEIGYENSKPKITLKKNKKYQFHASLSHEKKIAVAVVISFMK